VKGVHGEKFRTPDLGQQPVLGIKEIPRTGLAKRSNSITGYL